MSQAIYSLVQKILPRWIYRRLIGDWNKDGFRKYFINTGWIAIARVITLCISFLTIAIIARYLGPENYGKLSYAQSFVALFSAFAALGIDQILYRELVATPEKEAELLGTAFLARLFFGVLTLVVTLASALLINSEPIYVWLIGIIALSFILQPFGIIAHFFNAKVQAKYVSYTVIGVAFLIPALKLLVVYFDKGILYFAAIITAETLIYTAAYLYIYLRIFDRKIFTWTFSYRRLTSLLQDSWPILLASFSGYIYGRIDQVMIQNYLDSNAVGFYDIAVRLTELLTFLPNIIIASLFPAIMNARAHNSFEYKKRLRALAVLCLALSTISAIALYILAPYIIAILFGTEFSASVALLRIYVWSTIGTVGIILMQQYFITEYKSHLFLAFSVLGAVISVGLNFILIPLYGTQGAAYGTLLTLGTILIVFIITKKFFLKNSV